MPPTRPSGRPVGPVHWRSAPRRQPPRPSRRAGSATAGARNGPTLRPATAGSMTSSRQSWQPVPPGAVGRRYGGQIVPPERPRALRSTVAAPPGRPLCARDSPAPSRSRRQHRSTPRPRLSDRPVPPRPAPAGSRPRVVPAWGAPRPPPRRPAPGALRRRAAHNPHPIRCRAAGPSPLRLGRSASHDRAWDQCVSRPRVCFVAPPDQEVYRCCGVNATRWRRQKRERAIVPRAGVIRDQESPWLRPKALCAVSPAD